MQFYKLLPKSCLETNISLKWAIKNEGEEKNKIKLAKHSKQIPSFGVSACITLSAVKRLEYKFAHILGNSSPPLGFCKKIHGVDKSSVCVSRIPSPTSKQT